MDRSSIRQGNAVIAIKDVSDAILWSWHVWVTDEDINNVIEITNHQNVKYNFMPVNLGQCDGNTITYEERSCKVKFIAGDQSKEITIKQLANVIATGSNAPFYQWGRKDPLYPSNGMGNTTKIWYDKEGIPSSANPMKGTFSAGYECIKNCITTTGESVSSSTQVNGTWSSSEKGWYFYTNSEKTQSIFFPAVGYRSYSTMRPGSIGTQGCFWSAHPVAKGNNYYLRTSSVDVQPTYMVDRGFGYALRPCQD